MKRSGRLQLLVLIVFGLLVLYPGKSGAAENSHADFLLGFRGSPATFVIRLTNPERIREARGILASGPLYGPMMIGQVLSGRMDYNRAWRFHLDPDAIGFAESMKEVCDASPMYVQRHLAEVGTAFLPGGLWCPWNSYLIAEIR